MQQQAELANFRGDDDPRLVAAALACPVCLSGEVDWALDVDGWDAEVWCSCRACGHRRAVGLNSQQALRLYLRARYAASSTRRSEPTSGSATA